MPLCTMPDYFLPFHCASLRTAWLCLLSKPISGLQLDPTKPSLSRPKQTQLTQLLLIQHVLRPSKHLSTFLLNSLQFVNVSPLLWGIKLDRIFQMWSHRCQTDHCHQPADPVGQHPCKYTMLTHAHLERDKVWLNFMLLKVGYFPQAMLLRCRTWSQTKKKISVTQQLYEKWYHRNNASSNETQWDTSEMYLISGGGGQSHNAKDSISYQQYWFFSFWKDGGFALIHEKGYCLTHGIKCSSVINLMLHMYNF